MNFISIPIHQINCGWFIFCLCGRDWLGYSFCGLRAQRANPNKQSLPLSSFVLLNQFNSSSFVAVDWLKRREVKWEKNGWIVCLLAGLQPITSYAVIKRFSIFYEGGERMSEGASQSSQRKEAKQTNQNQSINHHLRLIGGLVLFEWEEWKYIITVIKGSKH